jgi:hypothetical protein
VVSLQLQNDRKAATGFRRWFSKTLIAAYVVLGLVLWQTIHVVGGGEMPFTSSDKLKMASTKFHADRDLSSRKNRPTKEPVAAFFERAKRGMTEQEIRGMIADFEAIGPMLTSRDPVESQERTKKLNEWHFKALDEALSLSAEQKREVWDSLNPTPYAKPQEWKLIPDAKLESLVFISEQDLLRHFYYGNSYADSWRHCSLTDDQVKLTYKKSLEARYEARREEDKKSGSISCHGEHLMIMHDPATGEYVDYASPPSLIDDLLSLDTVSGGIIDVTNTFPLTPDQKLADHRNDLLAQAKLLHPAQLRMALLMNPFVAIRLKSELDKPQE